MRYIGNVYSYLIVTIGKNLAVKSIINILAPYRVDTTYVFMSQIESACDLLLRNFPVSPVLW